MKKTKYGLTMLIIGMFIYVISRIMIIFHMDTVVFWASYVGIPLSFVLDSISIPWLFIGAIFLLLGKEEISSQNRNLVLVGFSFLSVSLIIWFVHAFYVIFIWSSQPVYYFYILYLPREISLSLLFISLVLLTWKLGNNWSKTLLLIASMGTIFTRLSSKMLSASSASIISYFLCAFSILFVIAIFVVYLNLRNSKNYLIPLQNTRINPISLDDQVLPDTDGDSLSDWDEAKVYRTLLISDYLINR